MTRKRNETLCLWLGSAGLARRKGQVGVHRLEYLNPVSFARFFTPFKNDRQAGNTVLQKTPFYLSAHTCPFRRLTIDILLRQLLFHL